MHTGIVLKYPPKTLPTNHKYTGEGMEYTRKQPSRITLYVWQYFSYFFNYISLIYKLKTKTKNRETCNNITAVWQLKQLTCLSFVLHSERTLKFILFCFFRLFVEVGVSHDLCVSDVCFTFKPGDLPSSILSRVWVGGTLLVSNPFWSTTCDGT